MARDVCTVPIGDRAQVGYDDRMGGPQVGSDGEGSRTYIRSVKEMNVKLRIPY